MCGDVYDRRRAASTPRDATAKVVKLRLDHFCGLRLWARGPLHVGRAASDDTAQQRLPFRQVTVVVEHIEGLAAGSKAHGLSRAV